MSATLDALDHWFDAHHHSAYSPLDGVPFPADIVSKAVSLNRYAVALTDHGSVSGHVLFEKAIEGFTQSTIGANTMFRRDGSKLAIKPIFGVEAYATRSVEEPEQKKNHITILARTQSGYRNLIQMVTESYQRGFYYRPTVDPEMISRYRDGLIVLSGCESGRFLSLIAAGDLAGAYQHALFYKERLGDAFRIELQHFPHQRQIVLDAWTIAEAAGIPAVLTCDVHYLEDEQKYEQQLLYSIRDRKPIDADSFCMHHAYPWEPDKLLAHVKGIWPELPWEAIFSNTAEIGALAEDYRLPHAPHVVFPMDGDKIAYVRQTCVEYLRAKGKETPEYIARLDRELSVIADKGYVDYFLVVADMIRWAKDNGIYVGPARGSAAGSLVCWGLRITEIDPVHWGLMFERFVDPTRVDLPDIDVDFEDERRAEVIEYIRSKYGAENVANIATFSRFSGRSTLDDIAKSFRIPQSAIDVVKRHLVDRSSGDQRAEFTIQDALQEPEVQAVWREYPALEYATKIQGKLRHIGKHAAGIVVTSEPVTNFMAVYKATSGESMVAVDWRDSAYLNLMKIDVLGLKELTLLRLICERVGLTLNDLYNLPLDDPETIALFNRRDYLGIFQFEGLAVRSVAERITFNSLAEIADVNAMARPGPLHAGATEAYIQGKESGSFKPVIEYGEIQPIIESTYGQIIYQESIMRILREIGGMDWQDVCDIRNIMGKSKGSEAFDNYWPTWKAGTVDTGKMPESEARHIWECIRLYGKHAFNASHAFAYGLLAYWSAYFKAHYPTEYYWAQLIKSGGKEDDARFINEAMRKGIEFAPISFDMKTPTWDIDEHGRITPGWTIIPSIGPAKAKLIAEAAPFTDTADMVKRVKGFGPKTAEAVEGWFGQSVADIYGLKLWTALAQITPTRIYIQDFRQGSSGVIVGKVIKINKKSRLEEWTTKGKDTSRIKPDDPDEYVVLTVEDETGSIMVYVSPNLYLWRKEYIWNNPTGCIAVQGSRSGDMPLISAKELYEVPPEMLHQALERLAGAGYTYQLHNRSVVDAGDNLGSVEDRHAAD